MENLLIGRLYLRGIYESYLTLAQEDNRKNLPQYTISQTVFHNYYESKILEGWNPRKIIDSVLGKS